MSYNRNIAHDQIIHKPFLKWGKTVDRPETNVTVFGHQIGNEDNIHFTVNELKKRTIERYNMGFDTSIERYALNQLTCFECLVRNCTRRNTDCGYSGQYRNVGDYDPNKIKITDCIKCHLYPVQYYDIQTIGEYSVKVQYFFDCSKHSIKTTTETVDASSIEEAEEKACKKWPNAKPINSHRL